MNGSYDLIFIDNLDYKKNVLLNEYGFNLGRTKRVINYKNMVSKLKNNVNKEFLTAKR